MSASNVSTPVPAYRDMEQRFAPCRSLMGGTVAMRRAGRTYLPQFPKETNLRYETRLASSVLYEVYRLTVETLCGRPFGKAVQLAEGSPAFYADVVEDVDLSGTDLTTFATQCLLDMLVYGKCHILADLPNTAELRTMLGRSLTKADEADYRIRGYLVRLDPAAVIGWRGYRIGGREELTELRYRLTTDAEPAADDPYGSPQQDLVIAWYPDRIERWERHESTSGREEWTRTVETANTLGQIPLVTVYTRREALLTAYPPLEGLAWLNIKHWQTQSDQDQIEKMARVPLLHFAGYDAEAVQGFEVGPFRSIVNRDPSARVEVIETNGGAVDVGQRALEVLVGQMESLAMAPLRRRPGNVTATELAIDAGRQVSDLEAYVLKLEQGLGRALQLTAAWSGQGALDAPVVRIAQDFGWTVGLKEELAELREDFKLGVIPRRVYLQERQRRGLLSSDLDIEEVLAEAEQEGAAGLFPGSGADPDPSADRSSDPAPDAGAQGGPAADDVTAGDDPAPTSGRRARRRAKGRR